MRAAASEVIGLLDLDMICLLDWLINVPAGTVEILPNA